jgi:hypothetical protein
VTQGGVTKRRFGGNARAATGPVAEASGMIEQERSRVAVACAGCDGGRTVEVGG